MYKPGNPRVSLRDAQISNRLAIANADQSQKAAQQRLSRFLEAREILVNVRQTLTAEHLRATLDDLASFINTSLETPQLSTVFLIKADAKAYVEHIKIADPAWQCISIHSKECPNFKSTAKLIVNRFTESDSHLVLDRRLTYDFHVLMDWLQATGRDPATEKLLVVVEDTDGFDPSILRDLIAHMYTYVVNGELNLHLILNLSVPLPLIEENLSQDNIVAMRVKVIQGLPLTTDYLGACGQALAVQSLQLRLSPALLEKVFDFDVPQVHQYLLYAIIAHFAGNPLASVSSVSDLQEYSGLVSKLPSTQGKDLNNIPEMSLLELSELVPELQVGGNVLDIVFNPNYRPLVEQALTDPRIYAQSVKETSRMSVPTSILYQLSRESSIYINIYDLYCAFKAMVNPVICDDDVKDWDKQSMAIFLESITALKMVGILRDCKRKFECVEKVSWKGV